MTLLLLGVVGGLVLLFLAGSHNQEAMRRQWETIILPWAQAVYDDIERQTNAEDRLVDFALYRATAARNAGIQNEAIHFLDLGLQVVARLSPDRIVRLRGVAVVSRMVAAMTPMEPLQPANFRTRRLVWYGVAAWGIHQFLVTTAERFRLRAYVLRRGLAIATGRMAHSAELVRRRPAEADREWEEILAACADLKTLSHESLKTFHALLGSMMAVRRPC